MFPYEHLTITCQTNSDIPPPFEHYYILEVSESPVSLNLSYEQVFTGREGISEEEILDEGFTMDDDFKWKGSLSKVWKSQLDGLLQQSRLFDNPKDNDEEYIIEVKAISKSGEETIAYVGERDVQKWTYLLQELRQAIYENDQIEAPLQIKYLNVTEKGSKMASLRGAFAERNFTIRVNDRPIETLEWSKLQELMRLIFLNTEIDPEQGIKGTPNKEGNYLLLPESEWYALGKGIIDVNPKGKSIDKITALLENLSGN